MNHRKTSVCGIWRSAMVCLLLGGLCGSMSAGTRKLLKMDLSKDRRIAVVVVPQGYDNVTIQRFNAEGGWEKFATRKVSAGKVRFDLPASGKNVRWRAMGRFDTQGVTKNKFPAKFYAGKKNFGPQKSSGSGLNWNYFRASGNTAAPGFLDDASGGESVTPEEADIWKVDGSTVYFFNQLRGLQVLDVSNPADPRITASLRLPAEGEDLYLLPGKGGARFLVLLTRSTESDYSEVTRINLVKVANGKAEIVQTSTVQGFLSDSRLAGDQLITATVDWTYEPAADYGYNTVSRLNECTITADGIKNSADERVIEGENPLISSGPNWLAVSVNPRNDWNAADVSVFGINRGGLAPINRKPVRTAGYIADKFKLQWRNGVLTTISQSYKNDWDWRPTTILENFRVLGPNATPPGSPEEENPLLGRLQLADGETLYATRFAGDKAYIVTFLQTDPLWVVDLSDAKNPAISGHIEVPGWSTHLEPIGDLLLAIGWESNTVAASLFNVADPAEPKLVRRLNLGAPGSYSEAAWDEQALKVLPDAGLAMIPLTSYDEETGAPVSVVQLLGIDAGGADLTKLGTIAHGFDARRADLIGDTVVSISRRALVTADISNPKQPKVLADVSLAWPADRVVQAGEFLVQIENGSYYGNGRATARVSRMRSPEEILSETDLGDGTVRAADVRDGKLYILREISSSQPWYRFSPIYARASDKLALDVYACSTPTALALLGTCSKDIESGMRLATDRLLWPQSTRPVVALSSTPSFWRWWGGPILLDRGGIAFAVKKTATFSLGVVDAMPYYGYPMADRQAPQLLVFDTSDPAAPTVGNAVTVGGNGTSFNNVCEAADGLVVLGGSDTTNESNGAEYALGNVLQNLRVVEVDDAGGAAVRPAIGLPGELFAISDLDSRGFLAYTRNYESGDEPAIKVSACDGFDAYEITGLDKDAWATACAGSRRLFIANADGVERHRLTDEGVFVEDPSFSLGWQPDQLRVLGGSLIGSRWNSLFRADISGSRASQWQFPAWSFDFSAIDLAGDGGLIVPFGEYGAEHLDR